MVVDLQHEVHFLNNQLHPIHDEEEEDPEMFIEDDGWEEEEVMPVDEGKALSDPIVTMLACRAALVTSLVHYMLSSTILCNGHVA